MCGGCGAVQAPVIPAGSHLDYWDSKDEALVSARNMEVYNHWGPVDTDARLPPERMSELFGTLATYYQPRPKQVLPLFSPFVAPVGSRSFAVS